MSKRCLPSPQAATAPEPPIFGIDVAKAELVIAQQGRPGARTIANCNSAIQLWLQSLGQGSRIALESTGRYSRLLCQLAHQAGLTVYMLNALDVYHYGKALGQRGKTDRLDAQLIAEYATHQQSQLRPWQPANPTLEKIRTLMRCRAQVVRASVAMNMSLEDTPMLAKQAAAIKRQFDLALKSIDTQLQALIKADPVVAQGAACLRSIQGVGPLGATLLATLLARIPFKSADALVAFTGLDPRPCDSGKKQGVRRLSKRGQPLLRQQMWMCAMSASRCSGFKAHYEVLRLRG
jgi:transposase